MRWKQPSSTSLQSGAVETLKELKKMNLKIGLCTTSSETAANYILQRFKIDDYFQVVVPRDKVKHVKPDTEQFELALKTLGANPQSHIHSRGQHCRYAKRQRTKSHRSRVTNRLRHKKTANCSTAQTTS